MTPPHRPLPDPDDQALHHAAELISQSDLLVVAAGAGMGVDSGLPDFRGDQGFWRAYPALGRAGLSFAEVASPLTFEHAPRLAWGFYGHRLALYRATSPHAGFGLLQRWAAERPHPMAVFTSNVDGQFQRAGVAEAQILECHGSIHWLQCLHACHDAVWPADALVPDIDTEQCQWRGPLPQCPRCGGLARPNILMFGDSHWLPQRTQAQQLRQIQALAAARRPVVVEIGAGTDVPSVRHFSHRLLQHHGARLVRINPRESGVPSPRDVGLARPALAALQALDQRLNEQPGWR